MQDFIDNKIPAESIITEDRKNRKGIWIKKNGADGVAHLARAGALSKVWYSLFGEDKTFYDSFDVDEVCFNDYVQKLIPRAVGYSKAMLDYFYRGKIEVEPVIAGTTLQHFHVKLKNTTTTGEEMTGGVISLAIKYRLRSESADHTITSPSGASPFFYRVVTLPGQYAIPRDQQSEQVFDLGSDPLPLFATDVTLQVIYRGQLGNEAGSVAVGSVTPEKYTSDIALFLPAGGAYAIALPDATGFSRIAVNANSLADLVQPDGLFELVVKYRLSSGDPYQGVSVGSYPSDPNSFYVIRANEANGVTTLQKGVTKELQFDISATPLPLWASDVYLDVIYRHAGAAGEKPLAIGLLDLAEPTPVDVFNNTDKVCINQQWYDAGSAEAIAAVGTDQYGDLNSDVFPHRIDNILYKTSPAGTAVYPISSTNNTLSLSSLSPGEMKRLGYILTDYNGFDYGFDEQTLALAPQDYWSLSYENITYPGGGFINQLSKGFSGMYGIRGKKMWGESGVIYDNEEYPAGSQCDWSQLPLP